MQVVIDISEEMYKSVLDGTYCGSLYDEIANGTCLPKGHGRLIDGDALECHFEYDCTGECDCCGSQTRQTDGRGKFFHTCGYVVDAPTVLEANKESRNANRD